MARGWSGWSGICLGRRAIIFIPKSASNNDFDGEWTPQWGGFMQEFWVRPLSEHMQEHVCDDLVDGSREGQREADWSTISRERTGLVFFTTLTS